MCSTLALHPPCATLQSTMGTCKTTWWLEPQRILRVLQRKSTLAKCSIKSVFNPSFLFPVPPATLSEPNANQSSSFRLLKSKWGQRRADDLCYHKGCCLSWHWLQQFLYKLLWLCFIWAFAWILSVEHLVVKTLQLLIIEVLIFVEPVVHAISCACTLQYQA